MTIEKQCCTLEQAKRLKELGVEQISYFIWGEKSKALMESWTVDGIEDTFYSAYTVAELGEVLPEQITKYFDFKGYIVPETGEYGSVQQGNLSAPFYAQRSWTQKRIMQY